MAVIDPFAAFGKAGLLALNLLEIGVLVASLVTMSMVVLPDTPLRFAGFLIFRFREIG